MSLADDIKPISYLKNHTAEILKNINETQRPIVITQNGEAKGVFLDTNSYENMRKALGLMKLLSQSESDIEKGNILSNDLVFSNLEKQIKNDP